MVTAVLYVLVLALLILSSLMLFRHALKLLSQPGNMPGSVPGNVPGKVGQAIAPTRNPTLSGAEITDRDEIVEMLERQFHSSPSLDS